MELHQRFEEILSLKGWSQTELATRMGRTITWVNRRINGKTPIKPDEAAEIAQSLGYVHKEMVLRRPESREPEVVEDALVLATHLAEVYSEMDPTERRMVRAYLESLRAAR